MFTGLIKTQGTIRRVDQRGDCMMTIAMGEPFPIEIGDSICCNGICLTAIKVDDNAFKVSLSAESMTRTTAKDWAVGTVINLEPSLTVGGPIGGHFVSGHVDGMAKAVACEQSGDSMIWEFEVPPDLAKFIAPKGSVTLDGISLTVNEVKESRVESRESSDARGSASVSPQKTLPESDPLDSNSSTLITSFSVNIIPHTSKVTSFGRLKLGDFVNLEIDMLARYVARLHEAKRA